jgi:molybdopterin/thiamine biosynthesis adenylyltransferase
MNDTRSPATSPSLPDRYARQTLFAGIGRAGQELLLASHVAIIGCGALGTVLANNLGRAGVGHLTIADRDFIEANNLQRQVLFDEDDLARNLPKAIAAAERLRRINSEIEITPLAEDINADNIEAVVASADLIMDGTDNFETRYLLNDACLKAGKPWIYSGVIASYGVTMNILPGDTACLRCVFPEMPLPGTTPTCDTAGVLNGIVGAMASIASTEALKILLGRTEKINRAMLWMDLWENTQDQMEIPRMPDCPACGQGNYEFLDAESFGSSVSLCGRNAVQVRPARRASSESDLPAMNFAQLAGRLREVGAVNFNEFLLRFRVDGYELTVFPDARAIIKGTDDQAIARSLYARYIGA